MRMATSAPSPSWRRAGLWMYVIAVIYAAISLVPFLWSIYTSVKPTSEVFQLFVPWRTLTLSSYTSILQNFPFGRWFLNSAIVAFIVTVGNLVVNTFAGYAFARLRFPGRGFLFYVFLGVMMIPGQVVLVPIYMLLARLGWIDTYVGLTVPFLLSSTMVFLSRQFFLGIPKELEEAARIDGIGYFGMFFRIMLPLARPLLAAQTILTFQGNWNSFLWPLLIGQTTNMYTLPVGLNSFYGQYNAYWNSVMAGMVLLTVPMMVVFIIFQRQFIQGVSQAGLKG
ncbi:carbohydrate ABC transporter permease [Alicyclobacillus acidocaldarius]|uniref:Binding-protein-dependent transport systems inner membrane component n=1 Tax=Alicyclobacillus acidocaldarius subsp. acidocaldarius (strain ATCC 27009 / DSM 446 / BCRC 14685 / JCM 5260 / KCTC 1825 / NBRC 15652 / NCIMB 11725 / NRRL B-14509 / 104-IA) TaxID=521098 RepID=C8WUW6_ALIAD|nr:carbohydrate ABC transporter permease [Alicyclobacillus acidocaldarius]ACV57955.1 binding-protein-dependent transport systems inner membrane component [Alicyclobacillus acidocaldarius subsp. acidocaldarius DSM 446]